MKKTEIMAIVDKAKYGKTDRLEGIVMDLYALEDERDLTKRMWFWTDFGNSGARTSFSRYYGRDYDIKVTSDFAVHYKRSASPSRKHAYAWDVLYAIWNGKAIKFTVGDAKKMADAIEDILTARQAKAEKAAKKAEESSKEVA